MEIIQQPNTRDCPFKILNFQLLAPEPFHALVLHLIRVATVLIQWTWIFSCQVSIGIQDCRFILLIPRRGQFQMCVVGQRSLQILWHFFQREAGSILLPLILSWHSCISQGSQRNTNLHDEALRCPGRKEQRGRQKEQPFPLLPSQPAAQFQIGRAHV